MSTSAISDAHIQHLQTRMEPLRRAIVTHPVYDRMHTLEHLHIFMQHHVYAVWDFMSLLKTLQNALTCTAVPWVPVGNADTRYLINEIVTGEESDVDQQGQRTSHFELYLDAMRQSGADVAPITHFLKLLHQTGQLQQALNLCPIPPAAAAFVQQTFGIIATGKPHLQAAVFTFGREDLIPAMFSTLVADLGRRFPEKISVFDYYLQRHIEVDGDHHSHLALQMTATLCQTPEQWAEAEQAVEESLRSRIALWDGVLAQIEN